MTLETRGGDQPDRGGEDERYGGLRRAAVEGVEGALTRLDSRVTFSASGPSGPGGGAAPARRMELVERADGGLHWRDPEPPASPLRGLAVAPGGVRSVVSVPVGVLAPNRIVETLTGWDLTLTPRQGLRRWDETGGLVPVGAVPPVRAEGGRILLLVHGTFSNSEAILGQLGGVEARSGFLAWARARYEHVLTFDHPTLSVSPVLNALDLARLFAGVTAPVDVVCHSRGGLVGRWWLEAFGGAGVGPRRAVFVACPLGGTSLASPPKVREALDLFTTVGAYLKAGGEVASVFEPYLTVAVGLMRVFVAVTGAAANSPMADLFFCAVPGLGSMSRVGNNHELERLMAGPSALPPYFAVSSDFRMERAGWRFWRNFQDVGLRAADWGASRIFDQPNDLVVDNRATVELFRGAGLPPDRVFHVGNNGEVYHTNYFLQPEVLGGIRRFLD